MPWVTRGLAEGVVTSRYPSRPDDYGGTFHARVSVRGTVPSVEGPSVERLCPTGAINVGAPGVQVAPDRCVLCGRCVAARPDLFAFDADLEIGRRTRPLAAAAEGSLPSTRSALARRTRALRRSVFIRHVDTGSDGAEEWEVAALAGPIYDVQRLGVFFTASPRHADLLLVTGAGSIAMAGPLRRTYDAMGDPKVVVAVGTDAASGGLLAGGLMSTGGVTGLVPVDVIVPGSPPSPFSILHGILLAVGLLGLPAGTTEGSP